MRLQPIDFYSKFEKQGIKLNMIEPITVNQYESRLWNFIKSGGEESRIFDLGYVMKTDKFRDLNKRENLKKARNELMRQGFIICIHSKHLDSAVNGFYYDQLIWTFNVKEKHKVFLDQFDEETIITEYKTRRKRFTEMNAILNVSCFDTKIGFNRFTESGTDELNRTWVYHWEQTFNFWLENYFSLIKFDLGC